MLRAGPRSMQSCTANQGMRPMPVQIFKKESGLPGRRGLRPEAGSGGPITKSGCRPQVGGVSCWRKPRPLRVQVVPSCNPRFRDLASAAAVPLSSCLFFVLLVLLLLVLFFLPLLLTNMVEFVAITATIGATMAPQMHILLKVCAPGNQKYNRRPRR